jgi:hypothetical protein
MSNRDKIRKAMHDLVCKSGFEKRGRFYYDLNAEIEDDDVSPAFSLDQAFEKASQEEERRTEWSYYDGLQWKKYDGEEQKRDPLFEVHEL